MAQTLEQLAQRTCDEVKGVLAQNLHNLIAQARKAQPDVVRRLEAELDAERKKAASLGEAESDSELRKQLNASLFKEMEAHRQLHELQNDIKTLTAEFNSKQEKAIRDAVHEQTKNLCSEFTVKLVESDRKLAEVTSNNALLQQQLLKAKPSRTPADQGNAAELEIEEYLANVLQGFMYVRNVSKRAHEMDIVLESRDGRIKIRIDVKSGARITEDDITKFYRDIDTLRPSGAILFSKCALRCNADQSTDVSIRRGGRRGGTFEYHIGGWERTMLVEAIHEIAVEHKVDLREKEAKKRPFEGAPEVSKAFKSCADLVAFCNDKAEEAFGVVSAWRNVGAEKNRVVAQHIRAAHAANENAVTMETVTEFEENIPARQKGRPPAATAHGKTPTPKKRRVSEVDPLLAQLRSSAAKLEDAAAKKPKVAETHPKP